MRASSLEQVGDSIVPVGAMREGPPLPAASAPTARGGVNSSPSPYREQLADAGL